MNSNFEILNSETSNLRCHYLKFQNLMIWDWVGMTKNSKFENLMLGWRCYEVDIGEYWRELIGARISKHCVWLEWLDSPTEPKFLWMMNFFDKQSFTRNFKQPNYIYCIKKIIICLVVIIIYVRGFRSQIDFTKRVLVAMKFLPRL